MATLQKFKLLATHCAVVAGSPTRSPSASPVIHLRRRKTLRMLLSRTGTSRRREDHHPDLIPPSTASPPEKQKPAAGAVSLKLKDFLLSSPPPPSPRKSNERVSDRAGNSKVRALPASGGSDRRSPLPRGGGSRPFTATLRQRLLRKSWRPVLVSIPE